MPSTNPFLRPVKGSEAPVTQYHSHDAFWPIDNKSFLKFIPAS